jgi:hypothetical protein
VKKASKTKPKRATRNKLRSIIDPNAGGPAIAGPFAFAPRALLDGRHRRGYKRAMMYLSGIATRLTGRIIGPAR